MLIVTLLSCTSKTETTSSPQDSTPPTTTDSAEICDDDEIVGTYFPDWDYCHQSELLPYLCGRLDWWEGEGCPSLPETALFYLSITDTFNWDETRALRCKDSTGTPYDVVWYNPYSTGLFYDEMVVFGTNGQMLAMTITYFWSPATGNCCEGHAVKGWSWGERIDIDCTNAPTIPIDLPDTADTSGITSTADTADTGTP